MIVSNKRIYRHCNFYHIVIKQRALELSGELWCLLPSPNVLVAISNSVQAVKLSNNPSILNSDYYYYYYSLLTAAFPGQSG